MSIVNTEKSDMCRDNKGLSVNSEDNAVKVTDAPSPNRECSKELNVNGRDGKGSVDGVNKAHKPHSTGTAVLPWRWGSGRGLGWGTGDRGSKSKRKHAAAGDISKARSEGDLYRNGVDQNCDHHERTGVVENNNMKDPVQECIVKIIVDESFLTNDNSQSYVTYTSKDSDSVSVNLDGYESDTNCDRPNTTKGSCEINNDVPVTSSTNTNTNTIASARQAQRNAQRNGHLNGQRNFSEGSKRDKKDASTKVGKVSGVAVVDLDVCSQCGDNNGDTSRLLEPADEGSKHTGSTVREETVGGVSDNIAWFNDSESDVTAIASRVKAVEVDPVMVNEPESDLTAIARIVKAVDIDTVMVNESESDLTRVRDTEHANSIPTARTSSIVDGDIAWSNESTREKITKSTIIEAVKGGNVSFSELESTHGTWNDETPVTIRQIKAIDGDNVKLYESWVSDTSDSSGPDTPTVTFRDILVGLNTDNVSLDESACSGQSTSEIWNNKAVRFSDLHIDPDSDRDAVSDDVVKDYLDPEVTHNKARRRSSIEFTVTKVTDSELKNHGRASISGRTPVFDTIDEQTEFLRANGSSLTATDTLTNSSITALLSSKWRDLSRKIKDYGEKTRFRKRIVSKWESLNYDTIENELHWQEKDKPNIKKQVTLQFIYRWLIVFFTGIFTACLAAIVHILVEKISHAKFSLIESYLDKCAEEDCLYQPLLIWIAINLSVTCLGSALVVYLQPLATGSGVPYIKSYLNGVKVPGLLTLECFISKVVGVIMSILGGLACGKEGPMAHSGSIIAAGLGRGRVRLPGKKRVSLYEGFRDDHEIRDFVSGGAASGVSAAFGAPVGGTLFSVEEAASFWSQSLTWRVFFSAMIACFCTNFLLSAFHGTPNQLSAPGLVRFNVFPNLSFDLIEIPVFVVMAVVGGLVGAAFVVLNYKLTVFRNRYIKLKWLKVAEAGLVATVTGVAAFIMIISLNSCTDNKPFDEDAIVAQMHCPEGQHHSLSTIFLATPEGCLKALLHDPYGSFGAVTLVIFVVVFFFLAVWTYGLSVSSGVFIPSLVIGAAWGRLFGIAVVNLFPGDKEHYEAEVGKYALIGAASQLGGVLRTTISLTVIIVECTGEISFGLPIMIVLMISKWVGDFISTGLYDMNVEVLGIPLLPWEPPALCDSIKASDLMNAPALCLNKVERVGNIVQILKNETFCGFPVVNAKGRDHSNPSKVRGLILRSQLLVLLKHKIFSPENLLQPNTVRLKDFRKYYLQYLKIEDIDISNEEMDYMIDLRPYITPNPYTIEPSFSLPRLFKLFRGLGLRHLIVVNDCNEPIGMITRKDLAKFRVESKRGLVKVEQLNIEDK